MFGDALSWYMTSMAEFWGSAFRIGLPQILLIVLVICWLRKKGSGKACGKCCWMWCCKCGGEEEESACADWMGDCGCTCGSCCCRQGGDMEADDEGGDDE